MVFFCLFGRDLGQKVWHLFIATYLSIRSLSANKVTLTLAWHVSGKSSGWDILSSKQFWLVEIRQGMQCGLIKFFRFFFYEIDTFGLEHKACIRWTIGCQVWVRILFNFSLLFPGAWHFCLVLVSCRNRFKPNGEALWLTVLWDVMNSFKGQSVCIERWIR